jgi:hypothetical protein
MQNVALMIPTKEYPIISSDICGNIITTRSNFRGIKEFSRSFSA